MAETGDKRWTTDMIFRAADIAANGASSIGDASSRPRPDNETLAPAPSAPERLGALERQRDGSLVVVSLSSSDTLFRLGCQVGDVILSMDGISASRLPDDMIPRLTCSRVIISRMGELVGLPDSEFHNHQDPEIRAQRDGELMDVAMAGIRQDPNAFITHNRNAGPPPTAREGMAQPADFNIAPTATA